MLLNRKNSVLYDSTFAELNLNNTFKENKQALDEYVKNIGAKNNDEQPFPEDTKIENEQRNNKGKKTNEIINEVEVKQFEAETRAIEHLKKILKNNKLSKEDKEAFKVLEKSLKTNKQTIIYKSLCCAGCCMNCCKDSVFHTNVKGIDGKVLSPKTEININKNNLVNNQNSPDSVNNNQQLNKEEVKYKIEGRYFPGCCLNCCKKTPVNAALAIAKANIASPEINLGKINGNMVNLGNQ